MIQRTLTWQQFKRLHSEDAFEVDLHHLEREADLKGEHIQLMHPTHDWVVRTIESEFSC